MALRHMVTEGVSVHFVILLVDRSWSTEAASSLLARLGAYLARQRASAWAGSATWRTKRKLIMGLLLALSSLGFSHGLHRRAGSVYAVHDHLLAGLRRPGIAARTDPRRLFRHQGIRNYSRRQPDHHHRRNFHGAHSRRFFVRSHAQLYDRVRHIRRRLASARWRCCFWAKRPQAPTLSQ